ncbi:hypothetical protein [Kineococcus sp. SYSU DK001]|uniref:hypothetical protein n=1 Tax=Kineococcus sp. SYSU DK001 TaxID=3383122 RepID=UPI003D7D2F74
MTTSARRGLLGGLAAGAVGTAVLNAVTHADVAWRGRDAGSMPADTAQALADRVGVRVDGQDRRTALGALTGTVAGLGVGALVGLARAAGLRFPPVVGGVVTGAAAMAATDLPAHALGVTDLRDWTAEDWTADAVPHLAFGLAAHATLRLTDPDDTPRAPVAAGLVARSALLGVAAGGRSSVGFAGPALTGTSTPAKVLALAGLGVELYADKRPTTPSRLDGPALPARAASGFGGGVALARRAGTSVLVPALAGAVGAVAGSFAGATWRAVAAEHVPDWQAAVVEDVASLALGVLACQD